MIVGIAVIYKALHKGNVNYRLMAIERSTSVRIAEPLRNEDCSTANLCTRQTRWYSVTKPLVRSGRRCKVQYTDLLSLMTICERK